jgi:hypothetical protein
MTETLEDGVGQVRAKVHEVAASLQNQVEETQQYGQELVDAQKERWLPVVEAGESAVNG